jgi:4-hydroxy-tetrahydrodipicolinate synthase
MVNAGLAHDFTLAKKLNDPLIEAYQLLFTENNPAGVKAFLYELGIIQNVLRLPVTALSAPVHQKVKAYLKTL